MTEKTLQEIGHDTCNAVNALFPGFVGLQSNVMRILGTDDLMFHFQKLSKDECPSRIVLNDTHYLRLSLSKLGGKFQIELCIGNSNLPKFRKISAQSADECANKLVRWFKKNQQAIAEFSK